MIFRHFLFTFFHVFSIQTPGQGILLHGWVSIGDWSLHKAGSVIAFGFQWRTSFSTASFFCMNELGLVIWWEPEIVKLNKITLWSLIVAFQASTLGVWRLSIPELFSSSVTSGNRLASLAEMPNSSQLRSKRMFFSGLLVAIAVVLVDNEVTMAVRTQ